MGRPRKELTEEQLIEVGALASCLNQEQIADYFGISRTTFWEMMKRDERVSEQYKKGRAKCIEEVATGLITEAKAGNMTAAIFFLKTQAGWRETEETTTEREPITINIVKPDGVD
jgi:hypothetical protein